MIEVCLIPSRSSPLDGPRGAWYQGGLLPAPSAVRVGSDSDSTSNGRIQKFSSAGAFTLKWGVKRSLAGQLKNPRGISIDSGGTVSVANTANGRIDQYSTIGVFEATVGKKGSLDGQFKNPNGVAVGPNPGIYVADTSNSRIQKFE